MAKRKHTDGQFCEAVRNATSIRGVLLALGLNATGGNYAAAKRRIKELGLDDSRFTGQAHLKGKTHNWTKRTPLEEVLVDNSDYGGGTFRLKQRLIRSGLLDEKCYCCGITQWMGRPAPLQLEHINGKRRANRLENLTLLCANCHAQTETFAGKNIGKSS